MSGFSTLAAMPVIWETFLYHGDEIEVNSVSGSYETKKGLSGLSSPGATPEKLALAVTLKTDDPAKKASLGVYIDGNLELEWETNNTDYQLKTGTIDVSWAGGSLHPIEIKLKAEAGRTAYNQLFEVYYSLRR